MYLPGIIDDIKNKFKTIFNDSVIGFDIGDQLIKLTEVDSSFGKIKLKNFGVVKTPSHAVEDGKIIKVEPLKRAIEELLEKRGFDTNKVVTAISGEEVISRTIEVPNMPEEELAEAIRWEAEDQIPVPLEEVIFDYEILKRNPDGGYQLLVIAVKRDLINKYLELFDRLNLRPVAIEIEPVAIARMVDKLYDDVSNIGIIDIGIKNTDISIIDQGKLLFTRTVGIGGDNITEEITEINDLSFEEAEEYKKNNDLFQEPGTNLILRNLTTAIYRSLDYFQVKNRDYNVDKIILAGGGGKLIGLDQHLTEEFGVTVEKISVSGMMSSYIDGVDNDYLKEMGPFLGVSIGLALRKEEEQ